MLRDDGPQPVGGRRWVCTLFEEERSNAPSGWKDDRVWQEVHKRVDYQTTVGGLWQSSPSQVMQWLWDEGVRCGNWPDALRGITATPNDPGYEWKAPLIDFWINAWQDIQNNGPSWPNYSDISCFAGRPDVGN